MNEKFIRISLITVLAAIFFNSCNKDDDSTTSKSTAIFNPNVPYGKVVDKDGNVYKTVTIGTQTWMAENLRTTKYNDGSLIPNITDLESWRNSLNGSYCNHSNTTSRDTIDTYGRLYNWYAVKTGKLAPSGWHVPTDEDWTILTNYLGGQIQAGGPLKESNCWHWIVPNLGATNETGFTALPGGYRDHRGFYYIGNVGYWWSTKENSLEYASFWGTQSLDNNCWNYELPKMFGLSVRCVKN